MSVRLLCLRCSQVSDVDLDDPPEACPVCNHHGIPANLDEDLVTIEVTWHELRVLVMWAEFHAGRMPEDKSRYDAQRTVAGIADRIHAQHLDQRALTFTGEIAELNDIEGVRDVRVHGINLLPPDLPEDES